MRIPLSWLKEYIDTELDPINIAEVLTTAGLEVEKIEKSDLGFSSVVFGKVLAATPHPEADRLKVARVTDGTQEFQVVCGASNCREGLVTAFAKVGATLTDKDGSTFTIKKGTLRGVESFGMLCSGEELGFLATEGIIEIPDHSLVGKELQDVYGDVVFEISLTPNLGHCMSIKGIARELAALTNAPYTTKKPHLIEKKDLTIGEKISVSIDDPVNCYRYCARYLENVQVGPSPEFIVKRLQASGLRPINNVVDITNYVLLECGQPLHAFDYDKIEGSSIRIDSTKEKTSFVTLDQQERELPEGSLVIYDMEKPIALAGIMGGNNSSVSETTTRLVLESAYFDPSCIRRTSKKMHLRSDSSSRFEKNVDFEAVEQALDYAAHLIQEHAKADIASGKIDEKTKSFTLRKLNCRISRLNSLLGTQLSLHEVENIFQRLRMHTETNSENLSITVTVPSFRNDIQSEIDLVEEAARIYGYNNIAIKPSKAHFSELSHCNLYEMEKQVRAHLVSEGLQECLNCDLISPKLAQLAQLALEHESKSDDLLIHVLQPSSVDQSILRPSLLPGFLQTVRHNFDHQNFSLSCFEIGFTHYKNQGKCIERPTCAILLTGSMAPHFWKEKEREADFFDLKAVVENLFAAELIDTARFIPSSIPGYHPGKQAIIESNGHALGLLGEIHPNILTKLDLSQRVFFAELDIEALFKASKRKQMQLKPLSQYPGTDRDWTGTFKKEVSLEEILSVAKQIPSKILQEVFLLDLYTSEKLGIDKKNITLRFIYRDDRKTIAFETAEKEHARILAGIKTKLASHLVSP